MSTQIKRTKHKSSAESIAWLDKDNNAIAFSSVSDNASVEDLKKHVSSLNRYISLMYLGMKDLRVQILELRSFINMKTEEEWRFIGGFYLNEREKLAELRDIDDNTNENSEDNIETV